ncbi:hypothetical protein LWC35_21665 [Pseudonocardia kujensis]|uniref:hypothetical protein n=1 Tax=Pseudonocardia kujensis TaxID=1128675 RepID=UPI001E2B0BE8|nr:hypothetical protein [Pseudonocardia kujensis]MCE0765490.1 hypothetical protein [Pseudonocardia kujensis]
MTAPVMWKMSRVRLDRVGPTAARFLDVTLDFTDERDGHPLDSILWLRNGGGKSTVLSLICALIRPRRRDFLATAATGKHLEDYVLGADTAHVVVEWSGPDGRCLVTGAVHEWADRAQPADPNRDHDRLTSRWYLFRPQPGRAELDLLPFEIDGRPATQKDFLAALRTWDAVPQAGVAITDGQDRWARLLDEHGLDPALFTALLQMNATEGGIEGQFQFRNADQFVRYLLELIVDPEVPGQVSAILERVRSGLAERPELLADLAFASEAVPLLRALAEGRTALAEAEEAERAVQERAAGLAGAIAAGVRRARQEEAASSDRQEELSAQVTELRGLAAAAEEREAALRALAARHRLDAARTELAEAQAGQERARAALAAWRGVVDVLRLREARARVRSLEEQLAAIEEDAEPLRRKLAEAAARYARSLDETLVEQAEQAAELDDRLSSARAAAEAARERARSATSIQGRLSGELAALRTRLAELDAGIAVARGQGHLGPEEEVAAAVERHRAADAEAAAELERLLEERAGLRERRDELRAAADSLATARRALLERHRTAAERAAGLRSRVAELAADDRLRALTGGDEVDPVAEAGDLEDLLTAALARTDRHRVELAVEGAEDERALEALAASGLLPPTLDLTRAQEAVEAAGIAVATGWRYLADSVPQREHAAVLRAAPALASGLLVHAEADLPAARQALAEAGIRPTTALVLATTAALDAVVQGGAAEQFELVTPAAALTDPAAAGAETAARERTRADRAGRDAALVADRERDDDLRRSVRALRADCPPGTLASLDGEVTGAAEELARVDEDAARVAADFAAVDEREQDCERRREAAEATRRAAGVAAAVLDGLAERLAAAGESRARAQALPAEIEAAHAEVEQAGSAEETARRQAREAEELAAAVRRSTATLREARDGLDVPAGDLETAEALSLTEARRAWESAERAYAREVSDSALVAAVVEARRAVEVPAQQVGALPAAVREAAAALADGPEAVDAEARAAATARAEQTAQAADEAVGSARSAVGLAEAELARLPAGGDLPDPPPADAAEALALAAEAAEEHAAHRAATERARTEHEKVGGLRTEARERASELGHQAQLLGVEPPPEETAGVDADGIAVEEAAAEVTAVRDRLDAAGAAVRRGRGAVEKVAREIVLWSAADRFSAVKPAVRDRFRVTDVAGELGPEAEHLAGELETYAANLRGRLEELEEHKSVVVTAMTGMVRQALKSLARAQSLSELPENLGPWAGHRFLDVGPRSAVETADVVVRDRCARLVDLLTSRGAEVPRGQELLWQATNAVVGDGNWKARVLKPSTTLALERVPVERMRKWSGGEKVTISLLLFCMVAKLRATSRGRDLPGLGALPLDNPLGKANYVVFLDLQRKVAAANGVQLIFLTGVGDMKAVGRFPNIIRLRNTANRGREYVRVADRTQAGEDPAGAIDTTRLHRDDPVLTLL